MSPAEAARLLDLPPDATPEQLETRFLELRRKLEDKIAKAPTPGLQAKYRASLAEITAAFEQLTLAADGAGLPVLQKVERVDPNALSETPKSVPSASATGAPSRAPAASAAKSSNREFLIVVLIAVLVLGGGGWWIVKLRAEKAEAARVAEVARAEAERQAAEKLRREADEKARAEAEFARLKAAQAEAKIRWETTEREAAAAERRLSELKADARSADKLTAPEQAELRARLAAQGDYVEWLQPTLARHPARTLLARLDALLATKALPEAASTTTELTESFAKLDADLAAQRESLLALGKVITLTSDPEGLAANVTDAYGRTFKGTTPLRLELPWGAAKLAVASPGPGWLPTEETLTVRRSTDPSWAARYGKTSATITSTPPGLAYELTNAAGLSRTGTTPANLADLPAGAVKLVVRHLGWPDFISEPFLQSDKPDSFSADFKSASARITSIPPGLFYELTNTTGLRRTGNTPAEFADLPVGPITLTVKKPNWDDVVISSVLEEGQPPADLSAEFKFGRIKFESQPNGAEVWRNGSRLGQTPFEKEDVIPGLYAYEYRLRGYWRKTENVNVKSDATAEVSLKLESDPLWSSQEISDLATRLTSWGGTGLPYASTSYVLPCQTGNMSVVVSSAMPVGITVPEYIYPDDGDLLSKGQQVPVYFGEWMNNHFKNLGSREANPTYAPVDAKLPANCGGVVHLVGLYNVIIDGMESSPSVFATSDPDLVAEAQRWASQVLVRRTGSYPSKQHIGHRVFFSIRFHAL